MRHGTTTADAGGSGTPVLSRGRLRSSVVRAAIGLALMAWLAVSGSIDGSRLVGLARDWPLTLAAVSLLFMTVVISSWRLSLLFSSLDLRLPLQASLRLTLIGALFSNFLPGSSGGDLVRVYLAARPNAGHRTEIATTMVIDRLIGLLALLLAPVLIAVAGRSLILGDTSLRAMVGIAAAGCVFIIAIVVISGHPHGALRRLVTRLAGGSRIGDHVERVFESVRVYRKRGRIIAGALALSLVNQALVIAAIQLILAANGSESPSWGAALLTPFGMLANALPLTPGGLGVGEAAFESLFLLAGLRGGAEAILSWRVLTTLIDLCGGVVLVAGRTDVRVHERSAVMTGSVRRWRRRGEYDVDAR